ncbi:MAG TPA: TetR/AcrR family transcriptional regulator [Beijerinckiaceae bacterium]|nr:TetR/AcrR family transcriptional regulator [Beijerinckiaceae bacterium]
MPRITSLRHAERQANILRSAEVCFARSGFHRTTMQDICREAGISAGAVYVYFDSKEALIEGLVARDRDEIGEALARIGEAEDFFAALEAALQSCVLDRPAHKASLFVEIVAEAHRNQRVAQSLAGCDRQLRSMLAGLIERARAEGRLSGGLPAERLAMMMAMLGDALFIRRAMDPAFDGQALVPMLMASIRALLDEPETAAPRPAAMPPRRPRVRSVAGAA